MDKQNNYTSMPSLTEQSTKKITTIKNIPNIGLDAPKRVQFKISQKLNSGKHGQRILKNFLPKYTQKYRRFLQPLQQQCLNMCYNQRISNNNKNEKNLYSLIKKSINFEKQIQKNCIWENNGNSQQNLMLIATLQEFHRGLNNTEKSNKNNCIKIKVKQNQEY